MQKDLLSFGLKKKNSKITRFDETPKTLQTELSGFRGADSNVLSALLRVQHQMGTSNLLVFFF